MSSLPRAFWIAICIAAVALPYVGHLDNGFVWLDQREILDGLLIVSSPREILDLLFDDRNFSGYYRPLYNLSFSLDLALWGRDPRGFHATSLLVHSVSVALVVWIALRSGWSGFQAASLGALWGLHPVQSETVGLIHCRADLLCAAFLLGALACALPAFGRGAPGPGRRAVSIGLFVLALYSKELAFLYVPAVAAWWLARERLSFRPDQHYVLAVFAAGAAAALHRLFASSTTSYTSELGLLERLATFGSVLLEYLRKLILPLELSLSDATWRFTALGEARVGVVLTLALFGALAAWVWRRHPDQRLWLALFALTLLPASQIVPILHFKAERYLYLPSLAFVGAALQAARSVGASRRAPWLAWTGCASVVALLPAFAWRVDARLRTFSDDVTLFAHETRIDPHYREGLSYLAVAADRAGRHAQAEDLYRASLARDPAWIAYVDLGGTVVNLTRNLLAQGRPEDVLAVHAQMRARVLHAEALRELKYNKAVAEFRLGRYEQALPDFVEYLLHVPTSPGALYLAGVSSLRLGNAVDARGFLQRYLDLHPDAPDAGHVRELIAALE